MDASFIQMLQGIDWSKQTAKEAIDLLKALERAVEGGHSWFAELSTAFGSKPAPQPRPVAIPVGVPAVIKPSVAAKPTRTSKGVMPRPKETEAPPKRGRGRPRKVTPEVMPRRAVTAVDPLDVEDHSNPLPVGVLNGSSFLPPGERPNNIEQLPPGHPRAGGGGGWA